MKSEVAKITMAAIIGIGILAAQGCGSTSIEGSWSITKLQMDGMDKPEKVEKVVKELAQNYEGEVSEEEIQQGVDMLSGIGLTFYENGSMSMSQSAYGMNVNGTWTEAGDNVYAIQTPVENVDVTLDGKELIMEDVSSGNICVFEKN